MSPEHMTKWRSSGLGLLVACLSVPLLFSGQPKHAPSNPRLAAEIDKIFLADLNGETPSDAVHARVRQTFAKYGVPSQKMVGEEAAEEYIALLGGEPLTFVESVLPKVERAAAAGDISENSYIYLRTQTHQKEIREKFNGSAANPALRNKIERLFKTDQAVRPVGKPWDLKKLQATDRADGETAHAIFAKYGLPTFALVGPEAAQEFDDVVQHQPLAFQKQVLPQMKADLAAGQVSAQSYAMLLDRVESSSGQPQTYGENFVCTPDGKMKPSPIADPEQVDRRRADIGLVPLSLYAKLLGEMYMNGLCEQVAAANRKAGHGPPTPQ